MGKEVTTFGDIEIEKPVLISNSIKKNNSILENVDIDNVLVFNKISSDEKNCKYLIFPKTYVKRYNGQTKWKYFLIEDNDLLNKYNTICDKVNSNIKKEFDSKPVYKHFFSKTKIKFYGDEATDFHHKEIPKVGFNHTCLAVISLDSALKKDEN